MLTIQLADIQRDLLLSLVQFESIVQIVFAILQSKSYRLKNSYCSEFHINRSLCNRDRAIKGKRHEGIM